MKQEDVYPDVGAYVDLLLRWSPRLDLVSTGDQSQPRLVRRHVDDALRAAPWVRSLRPGDLAVDVGSGAGLPGVPLALAAPHVRWRLVEPRRRRAAFLEEAVRELGLNAEVVVARVEDLADDPEFARRHRLATARAVAAPARAFGLLRPLLAPGGKAAVWVGERARIPSGATIEAPGVATMTMPDDD